MSPIKVFFFTVVLLCSGGLGFYYGFFNMLFKLITVVGTLVAAILLQPHLTNFLAGYLSDSWFMYVLSSLFSYSMPRILFGFCIARIEGLFIPFYGTMLNKILGCICAVALSGGAALGVVTLIETLFTKTDGLIDMFVNSLGSFI